MFYFLHPASFFVLIIAFALWEKQLKSSVSLLWRPAPRMLREKKTETEKTTRWQRKQQQIVREYVLHNVRVLETAVSLQLSFSFGEKPGEGWSKVSQTNASLLPFRPSVAAFNQSPANERVICLQAGNFLLSERLFFCGRSHTFHHTISAYWLKCSADKRKETTQLDNFLFSHMVPSPF